VGARKIAAIRITNTGDYDIAVLNATVTPRVYFSTEDMEVRTPLQGAAGQEPSFLLKPWEDKQLFIAPHFENGIARELTPQRVSFRIAWRRCNATWLPQVPVFVRTNTTTIRRFALEEGQT
jgi:hypothetical protein